MYGKFVLLLSISIAFSVNIKYKRALQVSHEKPQWEKWADAFLGQQSYDQVTSLVQLITLISEKYLSQCTPVILYDRQTEKYDNLVLQKLLKNYPLAYIHGQITENYKIKVQNIIENQKTCISFIIFIEDVMKCKEIIGDQNYNKVVIVARSSQWRVFEFLGHERSQTFTNLLVIAKSDKPVTKIEESAYILYTHRLYIDAIGSNKPKILTSWINGNLTRPEVNLFPKKMTEGFAGHRFIVSYAHQPPFVIKRGRDREGDVIYDGIEVRLVQLLSKMFNFTTDFREATNDIKIGSSAAVMETIKANKANLGIGGSYMTPERVEHLGQWHSSDCASFVSLASTALPRYRAIMGPFHWTVWLTITFVYLFAIIPLVFSDKQTLRPLLKNPEEIENMFWYVFGTFTNCFTFTGKGSWSNTKKITTRLLIGFYWVFTIIITACYTGSIIAFVTLPVYPSVIDTIDQLIGGRYQIGLLDKGGWQNWYENTTDKDAIRLLKKADYVPTVEAGLKNMTKAFFWPYAFLGSHAQLDYIVRTNFTTTSKRSLLHISKECFVPYYVSLIYQKNAIYKDILNKGVLRAYEFGFLKKLKNDVEWLTMRSATGQLLAANTGGGGLKVLNDIDRALTLDDTQGMFLLLSFGFVLGGVALLVEWFGGCFNLCKRSRPRTGSSIISNPRSHESQTPRQKLDSVDYTHLLVNKQRLGSIPDTETNHVDKTITDVDVTNHVTVHNHVNASTSNKDEKEYNFDEEINKLFENIFGEENVKEADKGEEIISDTEDPENLCNNSMKKNEEKTEEKE